jgi:hypothetical protein
MLAADHGEIIFHDPTSAGRATIASVAKRLQRNPVGTIEVDIGKMGLGIDASQSNLLRPPLSVGNRVLGRGDAVKPVTDVIKSTAVCPTDSIRSLDVSR